MKLIAIVWISLFINQTGVSADTLSVYSPDHTIRIEIILSQPMFFKVSVDQQIIITAGLIDLLLGDGTALSGDVQMATFSSDSVKNIVHVPISYRSKNIDDQYNEIHIRFRQAFDLIFRVYNHGFAYRIGTRYTDSIIVKSEIAHYRFNAGSKIIAPIVAPRSTEDTYHTSFEEPYQFNALDSMDEKLLMFSPVVVDNGSIKIAVTESDLDDYPGMFLIHSGVGLQGEFAPYPLEEKITDADFPEKIVIKRENFIAKTKGTRVFPWRVFMIAREDKEFPANNMVYLLASPNRLKDVSWIKPGFCTDEWIIDINLFNVPFKTGINTATYKYYIDFAKRFGFDRIMMDAGWSDTKDLFKINPNIDMKQIISYAKTKGIKLNLWTCAATLDRQLDSALNQFSAWGIDFIMTDFIDRDDQKAVNFCKRITEACARHKIMIMFHGIYPPKGFNRTYPNNITREAVLGSEYNAWSDKATPEHNLIIPFTRMLAGPMDYEPGILDNATQAQFKPIWGKVMSQGTRSHQLAMFIVYDSPMQIFAGNPSQGMMEPAFMNLIGNIPASWDTTIILDGKIADYILTARKSGKDWYIGGMTDWTARSFKIPLTFLSNGLYETTMCVDGINADRYPSDYKIYTTRVTQSDTIQFNFASGGGGLIRLKKRS